MASKATQEYRDKIAEMFIKGLEEEGLEWRKNWGGMEAPINFSSKVRYKGINRFYLGYMMQINGWNDNRFMTFNQIKAKDFKLKAGSKGLKVEYWMPYDLKKKKALSWKEYREEIKNLLPEEIEERFGLIAKYYTVFNGTMIEGLPELEIGNGLEIEPDQVIEKISKGMEVEILHDGGDRAFYRPSEDKVHLPLPSAFDSNYDYNSTALHELGHATGAANRLNRDMGGGFGGEEYAKEELVAEITSAFMGVYLGDNSEATDNDLNNHKAYVQSWISSIKEKPDVLFNAIKQAEVATQYMEEKGELIKEKEKESAKIESLEEIKEKREKAEEKQVAEPGMEMWC